MFNSLFPTTIEVVASTILLGSIKDSIIMLCEENRRVRTVMQGPLLKWNAQRHKRHASFIQGRFNVLNCVPFDYIAFYRKCGIDVSADQPPSSNLN